MAGILFKVNGSYKMIDPEHEPNFTILEVERIVGGKFICALKGPNFVAYRKNENASDTTPVNVLATLLTGSYLCGDVFIECYNKKLKFNE